MLVEISDPPQAHSPLTATLITLCAFLLLALTFVCFLFYHQSAKKSPQPNNECSKPALYGTGLSGLELTPFPVFANPFRIPATICGVCQEICSIRSEPRDILFFIKHRPVPNTLGLHPLTASNSSQTSEDQLDIHHRGNGQRRPNCQQ